MWYGNNWMIGMHLVWWIFWIALLAVGFAVLLRVRNRPPEPPSSQSQRPDPTPLQVLERRYAAGEISTDEFEERKAHLLGQHG